MGEAPGQLSFCPASFREPPHRPRTPHMEWALKMPWRGLLAALGLGQVLRHEPPPPTPKVPLPLTPLLVLAQ